VRLVKTRLVFEDIRTRISDLVRALFQVIPCGVGAKGAIAKLSAKEVRRVLERGARWAIEQGYGEPRDQERTEEAGELAGADPTLVSDAAVERGSRQLGTLGSGNHFLEVDVVDEIYLPDVAARFGLERGAVAFQIHSGSRGLGYQVCDDSLAAMGKAMERIGAQASCRSGTWIRYRSMALPIAASASSQPW